MPECLKVDPSERADRPSKGSRLVRLSYEHDISSYIQVEFTKQNLP